MRKELPIWYNKVLPEAVMLNPSSATAERLFSMMEWMHRDDKQSAMKDNKETALMLKCNLLQRQRTAPAIVVELLD